MVVSVMYPEVELRGLQPPVISRKLKLLFNSNNNIKKHILCTPRDHDYFAHTNDGQFSRCSRNSKRELLISFIYSLCLSFSESLPI